LGPQIRALIKAAMSASVSVGMGSSSSATQMITSPIPMKPYFAAGPLCVCVCVCVCVVQRRMQRRPCTGSSPRSALPHRGSRGSQAHCGTCYLATAQPCRSTAHETEVLAGSSRITSDDAATTPTRVPTGLSRAPPTAAMNQSLHGIRNLNSNPHDLSPEALCLRKA